MDKLNKKQRIVVWASIVLAVVIFVFRPVEVTVITDTYSYRTDLVYRPITETRYESTYETRYETRDDIFIGEYVLLVIVTWALMTSLKTKG